MFLTDVREIVMLQYLNMNKITKLKKIFGVFMFLGILIILILFFVQTRKKKNNVLINPPIPTPYIPQQTPKDILKNSKIELAIKEPDFPLSKNIVLLNQNLNISLNENGAKQIANNLGFFNLPIIANDAKDGNTYIWNYSGKSLTIVPKTKIIRYYSSSKDLNVTDKKLDDKSMMNLAEEFLINKIGLSKDNIKFSNFLYLNKVAGYEAYKKTTAENAMVIQLNYYPSPSDYPIYTLNDQNTVYSVQILKDGSIYYAEIVLLGTLIKGQQNNNLMSFKEFSDSLTNSIIMSLNDRNVNLPDLNSNSIISVSLNNVELVYLFDKPTASLLQPIF